MDLIRLGDIATYINGYAFKPRDWREKGIPIIRIQNLNDSNKEYNYFDGEIDSKYLVNEGDILISWSASIGVYEWRGQQGVLNQHIFKVDFNKIKIDKKYFKYIVSIALNRALQYMHGSTMKHITKQYFDNILIPVPLFNQQVKIANILDQAQELIDKRKAQIEALDELVQSVFYDMFGDPVQNPFSFDQYKIKDLVIDDKYAIKAGPFGSALKKEYYVESGYKVYGQEQVIQGDLAYGDYYIDEDRYRMLENCKIQSGDLLISLVGTFGKMLVVPDNFQEGIINPRLMKISFDQSKILPQFFKSMFQNEAMIKYMNRNTHGATMGILNTTIIKELNVIVPSLEMQLDYLNRRMFIEKQKELLNESLVELENNFNSLMQRAFNGEPLC